MEQGNKAAPKIKAHSPFFLPAEILHSLIVDMTYVGWRKAAAASGRGGRGWGGRRGFASRDVDYQGQQIACSCLRSTRSLWRLQPLFGRSYF